MPDAPCSTAAQPAVKAGGVHRLDISLAEKLAAARRNGVLCFEDRYGSRYWFKEPSANISSDADVPYDPEQDAATRLAAGAAKRPTPPRVSPSSAQLPHNRLAAAARSSGPGECSRGPAFSAMQEIERDKLEMAISSSTVRVKKRLLMGRVRATGAERGRQMTSVACTDRILSRAGVRARRERSPIFCAGGTSLETCSCVNFWAAQIGRPLEL